MKRGLSGRTRRGAPPLRRQRIALRVVQLTLFGVAATLAVMAGRAWQELQRPSAADLSGAASTGPGEVAAMAIGALVFAGLAVAMGFRFVRGPEPPDLG